MSAVIYRSERFCFCNVNHPLLTLLRNLHTQEAVNLTPARTSRVFRLHLHFHLLIYSKTECMSFFSLIKKNNNNFPLTAQSCFCKFWYTRKPSYPEILILTDNCFERRKVVQRFMLVWMKSSSSGSNSCLDQVRFWCSISKSLYHSTY